MSKVTEDNPFGESKGEAIAVKAIEAEVQTVADLEGYGNPEYDGMSEEKTTTHEPLVSYEFVNSAPYPFITPTGDLKLGLSIIIKEDSSDDIFTSESSAEAMLIVNSETGQSIMEEKNFNIDSLNKTSKQVSTDIFENLANARKTTTLTKAHKNLLNGTIPKYDDLLIDDASMTILKRSMKKTSETSKGIMMKIRENISDDLEGTLSSYAFKKHMMITGDAGQSKTYTVDKYIFDNKLKYVEEIAHNGIEAIDLIGHYIKKPTGEFIWKDGSFSQAFRIAQSEKVVYFIDEMLRMPARELNVLVGSLTPNSRGQLTLKTMRYVDEVDGIATTETITVPEENFWVIATSNQGASYQTSRIDEALKDRFRLFYQKLSIEEISNIVTIKYARIKGSSVAVKSIVSLISKTEEIQQTGNIPRAFTVRHLSEAIDNATSLGDVKKKMIELIPNIVSIDSDGAFNKEQIEIVKALIKKTI